MSVLEELDQMLRDAATSHTWGQIQIDLQDGKPVVLRRTITRKLNPENNREHPTRY